MCFYWNDAFLLSPLTDVDSFSKRVAKKLHSESMIIAAAVVLHSEIFSQTQDEKESQFNSWQPAKKGEEEEAKEIVETESIRERERIRAMKMLKASKERLLTLTFQMCTMNGIRNTHHIFHIYPLSLPLIPGVSIFSINFNWNVYAHKHVYTLYTFFPCSLPKNIVLTACIVPAKQSGTKSERQQNEAPPPTTTATKSIKYNNTIVATSPEQYDGRLSFSISISFCVVYAYVCPSQ